jgi:hypothetical protein
VPKKRLAVGAFASWVGRQDYFPFFPEPKRLHKLCIVLALIASVSRILPVSKISSGATQTIRLMHDGGDPL